jgi:hypothetical protein
MHIHSDKYTYALFSRDIIHPFYIHLSWGVTDFIWVSECYHFCRYVVFSIMFEAHNHHQQSPYFIGGNRIILIAQIKIYFIKSNQTQKSSLSPPSCVCLRHEKRSSQYFFLKFLYLNHWPTFLSSFFLIKKLSHTFDPMV